MLLLAQQSAAIKCYNSGSTVCEKAGACAAATLTDVPASDMCYAYYADCAVAIAAGATNQGKGVVSSFLSFMSFLSFLTFLAENSL